MAVWLATEFGKGAQGESNVEEPEAGLWFLPFTIHIVTLRALSDNQIIPKLPGELLLEFAPKNLEFYAYSRNAFEVVAPFFLIEVFVTVLNTGSDWFSRKSEHLHCQSGVCSRFEKHCPFCWFCVFLFFCVHFCWWDWRNNSSREMKQSSHSFIKHHQSLPFSLWQ